MNVSTGRGFFNRYPWPNYSSIQQETTEEQRRVEANDQHLVEHRRLYLLVGTCVVLLSMGLAAVVLGVDGYRRQPSASKEALRIKENRSFSVDGMGGKGEGKGMVGEGAAMCESDGADRTLKLVHEVSFFDLFDGERKYEASGVVVRGDYYYVICDSNWSIFQVHKSLKPSSKLNVEITHLHDDDDPHVGDSQYESILYDDPSKEFYLVREAIPHDGGDHYHAHIEKIKIKEKKSRWGGVTSVSHDLVESCTTEFMFYGDNKGLEGMMGLRDASGELYFLGLCEGNHCQGGADGKDQGHGRLIVMRRVETGDGGCQWSTVRLMNIPRTADFQDYSAVDYNPETGLVAITSQEDSKVWVGKLINPGNSKTFHPDDSYLEEEGEVFRFPRDEDCEVVYCNIEGVHWIGPKTVVTASDKMKSGGRQPDRCADKDQSIHVFTLPL